MVIEIMMAETIWTPLVFGEIPMDSRLEIISEKCLHLGQLKEYSSSKCMEKTWEIHGKSMGNPWKAVENHDDMDMSLSELGTNPAVLNHIWGTRWYKYLSATQMAGHPV